MLELAKWLRWALQNSIMHIHGEKLWVSTWFYTDASFKAAPQCGQTSSNIFGVLSLRSLRLTATTRCTIWWHLVLWQVKKNLLTSGRRTVINTYNCPSITSNVWKFSWILSFLHSYTSTCVSSGENPSSVFCRVHMPPRGRPGGLFYAGGTLEYFSGLVSEQRVIFSLVD